MLQFGADPSGTRDSSAAFTEAIRQLDVVNVPAGTFLVGGVPLRAGVTLTGEGEASVLRQRPGPGIAVYADSGSSQAAANLSGITLRGLQLRGNADTEKFSEHVHLLSLNGVSNARVEQVVFRGFRGDGFYLGSSHQAQGERHNRNVVVRECVFDGINRENRNGVSVIDCDGLVIEKCRFTNLSRHDMPGAIDLEPNANAFHIIRNVRIAGNRFAGVGGGTSVALYVPKRLTTPVEGIVVEDNAIDGGGSIAFAFVQLWAPPPGAPGQRLSIRRNKVGGRLERPFALQGVGGVELLDNRFEGSTKSALVGNREPRDAVRNIALRGNSFRRCGSEEGAAVSVYEANLLVFDNNEWVDCGNGKPGSCAVDFVGGASQRVSFSRNRFSSPTPGRMQFAVRKEAAHHFDAASNGFAADNTLGGLRNDFETRRPARR